MTFYSQNPVLFYGISHVTATLSSKHPEVGTRITHDGEEYVWAYHDCNSDIAPSYMVQLQSGATGMSVTITNTTNTGLPVGIVKHATLTTNTYGWLLTRGHATVEMTANSGTVAVNGYLTVGANGTAAPSLVQTALTTTDGATIETMQPIGQAMAAIVSSASGSAYVSLY